MSLEMEQDTGLRGLDLVEEGGWSALESLGRHLHVPEADVRATLQTIVTIATEAVSGCDYAGVNLLIKGHFQPQAIFGDPPRALDALQQATGTGPCIDASRTQTMIEIPQMSAESRWPQYAELAIQLGVVGMLCAPLWVDDQRLGSVSLYSSAAPFHAHDARVAQLFAAHAAVALSDAQRTEKLRRAMHNRDVIGQAKGILMERHKLTADQAFAVLSKNSQRHNRPVIAIALQLTEAGELS